MYSPLYELLLCFAQVSDLTQENAMLRGKLNSMKEYLSNAELETKASRETIMRLVSEAEREQRVATQYTMQIDKIKMVSTNTGTWLAVASSLQAECCAERDLFITAPWLQPISS